MVNTEGTKLKKNKKVRAVGGRQRPDASQLPCTSLSGPPIPFGTTTEKAKSDRTEVRGERFWFAGRGSGDANKKTPLNFIMQPLKETESWGKREKLFRTGKRQSPMKQISPKKSPR